eukprot:PhF_6_TR10818/c0_g1_i2/m.17439
MSINVDFIAIASIPISFRKRKDTRDHVTLSGYFNDITPEQSRTNGYFESILVHSSTMKLLDCVRPTSNWKYKSAEGGEGAVVCANSSADGSRVAYITKSRNTKKSVSVSLVTITCVNGRSVEETCGTDIPGVTLTTPMSVICLPQSSCGGCGGVVVVTTPMIYVYSKTSPSSSTWTLSAQIAASGIVQEFDVGMTNSHHAKWMPSPPCGTIVAIEYIQRAETPIMNKRNFLYLRPMDLLQGSGAVLRCDTDRLIELGAATHAEFELSREQHLFWDPFYVVVCVVTERGITFCVPNTPSSQFTTFPFPLTIPERSSCVWSPDGHYVMVLDGKNGEMCVVHRVGGAVPFCVSDFEYGARHQGHGQLTKAANSKKTTEVDSSNITVPSAKQPFPIAQGSFSTCHGPEGIVCVSDSVNVWLLRLRGKEEQVFRSLSIPIPERIAHILSHPTPRLNLLRDFDTLTALNPANITSTEMFRQMFTDPLRWAVAGRAFHAVIKYRGALKAVAAKRFETVEAIAMVHEVDTVTSQVVIALNPSSSSSPQTSQQQQQQQPEKTYSLHKSGIKLPSFTRNVDMMKFITATDPNSALMVLEEFAKAVLTSRETSPGINAVIIRETAALANLIAFGLAMVGCYGPCTSLHILSSFRCVGSQRKQPLLFWSPTPTYLHKTFQSLAECRTYYCYEIPNGAVVSLLRDVCYATGYVGEAVLLETCFPTPATLKKDDVISTIPRPCIPAVALPLVLSAAEELVATLVSISKCFMIPPISTTSGSAAAGDARLLDPVQRSQLVSTLSTLLLRSGSLHVFHRE